jgi:hypothetical protein
VHTIDDISYSDREELEAHWTERPYGAPKALRDWVPYGDYRQAAFESALCTWWAMQWLVIQKTDLFGLDAEAEKVRMAVGPIIHNLTAHDGADWCYLPEALQALQARLVELDESGELRTMGLQKRSGSPGLELVEGAELGDEYALWFLTGSRPGAVEWDSSHVVELARRRLADWRDKVESLATRLKADLSDAGSDLAQRLSEPARAYALLQADRGTPVSAARAEIGRAHV